MESVVVRRSDIMSGLVENELVMMDVDSGLYFSLDLIGSDIWERLVEPLRVATLCEQLCDRYAVDAVRCQREVLELLVSFLKHKLIRIES